MEGAEVLLRGPGNAALASAAFIGAIPTLAFAMTASYEFSGIVEEPILLRCVHLRGLFVKMQSFAVTSVWHW